MTLYVGFTAFRGFGCSLKTFSAEKSLILFKNLVAQKIKTSDSITSKKKLRTTYQRKLNSTKMESIKKRKED